MRNADRDMVVTGVGVVCAIGEGQGSVWGAIATGRGGIGPIRRFPVEDFGARTGAVVEACSDPGTTGSPATMDLCRRFAEGAAREAMRDADLGREGPPPDRIGFVFGTGLVGEDRPIHRVAEALAGDLGLRGPCLTVSTACTSSTNALGFARDILAMDAADAVVCGGADVLTPEVFAGFHALGVLSPGKCAPFSLPFGTTIGEGAGFVVLERGIPALRRGVRIRAALAGYGLSGDAFHETSPDPTGSGVERAIRGALDDAGLRAEDIGYVNAHGSGTQANDSSEWSGIRRGLGPHSLGVPVSSTKGALGHAQGAAGVIEIIVTILAMEHGVVPPTLNHAGPRRSVPADPVGGLRPRPWSYRHALCLNSAFGGCNAAVVLSRRDPVPGAPATRDRRPVGVFGVGMAGPCGIGVDPSPAGAGPGAERGDRVPALLLEEIVPSVDPRGLDPASSFLTAAVALALLDAGLPAPAGVRDRIGLLAGAVRPSPESLHAFRRSIAERGLRGVSASAFARIVLNAPAGFCSKLLSLRGPLSTLTTGAGSGLAAVALAAEMVSTRGEADWMVAAGVDERETSDGRGAGDASEGAVSIVLGAMDPARAPGRAPGAVAVRLAGWGIAGPGQLREAVRRARGGSPAESTPPEALFPEASRGLPGSDRGNATASASAFASAVLALRRGEAERALVTSDEAGAACVALVLAR